MDEPWTQHECSPEAAGSASVLDFADACTVGNRTALRPKVMRLDSISGGFVRILGGPPETMAMKAGLVTLAAGESVGLHSTGAREELIVVLDGQGELRVQGESALQLVDGSAAYCPPHAEHEVVNTGPLPLRYLYVVAPVGTI